MKTRYSMINLLRQEAESMRNGQIVSRRIQYQRRPLRKAESTELLHPASERRVAPAPEREQLREPDGPHHQVLLRAEVIAAQRFVEGSEEPPKPQSSRYANCSPPLSKRKGKESGGFSMRRLLLDNV